MAFSVGTRTEHEGVQQKQHEYMTKDKSEHTVLTASWSSLSSLSNKEGKSSTVDHSGNSENFADNPMRKKRTIKEQCKNFSRADISALEQQQIGLMVTQSNLLNTREGHVNWSHLPRFVRGELVTGKILGCGAFGHVKEVTHIRLRQDAYKRCNKGQEHGYPFRNDCAMEGRKLMSRNCISRGFLEHDENSVGKNTKHQARYAIKAINKANVSVHDSHCSAVVDLANEAYYLSAMSHPNIITLHGLAMEEPGRSTNFFIVLDRLYDTLSERIVYWKKSEKKRNKIMNKVFRSGSKSRQIKVLIKRLKVAAALADAIKYIHSKNLLHRDLKPENIGFDADDDVKIFDFGLAKEIHPTFTNEEHGLDDETYKLSGGTGSLRYMAPEVFRNEAYNASVDVYSFGIVLWEILALDKPFRGYDEMMMKKLVYDREFRPNIDESWPHNVQNLLPFCWAADYRDRLPAANVAHCLKEELIHLTNS